MVDPLTFVALPLPRVLAPWKVILRKTRADTVGRDPWRNFSPKLQLCKAEKLRF